ncbi:CybS-domain-containing protein [Lipomyces kononenkoae]|uniref:CybS-domain-containing protein n=1 Tax=Lipomyces kononenkoae TaxID=34357 RepID=A0ACC3SV48_LIPKO
MSLRTVVSPIRSSLAPRSYLGLSTIRNSFPSVARVGPAAVRHLGIPPLIAQPPGGIVGTVNDPVKVPPPDRMHGSYHWTFDRIIAIGLIPLTVAPFVSDAALAPAVDSILVSGILVHSYFGFQSCIIDYIPKREFGRVHDFCMWLLFGGTIVTGYGFYKFETEDIGLAGTIAKAWKA